MDLSGIGGLIFDKDGTLFDFAASWGVWTDGLILELADGDGPRADALALRVGYDRKTRRFAPDSPVIAGTVAEIAEVLLPALPGHALRPLCDRMEVLAAQAPVVPVVPLVPLMARLRARGLRLGVMTNDSEAPARAHLVAAGAAGIFDPVLGADSGFGAKPSPDPLLACAARWALPASRIAMIGDSRHDLTAGRAAGMRTVAVLTGLASAADLLPLADVVLPDISGLEGWLDSLALGKS